MRSLVASIRARQASGLLPVIAEIKPRSPKEGDLLAGRDPRELALAYAALPVAGISVVTEPHDFGGSVEMLRRVRDVTELPILRKDFPQTEADLEETREAGADAILLIVKMLEVERLVALHRAALDLGLETLVEVHDPGELAVLREHGIRPSLIGINNRDIAIGETDAGDVGRTESFAARLPGGVPRLSESAITGPDDARRARDAGADAVLVGTAILRAADPAAMIRSLVEVGSAAAPGGRP
ncbi:MAG: indole-3-glycerol-phosphate synthase [Microbacteriaceae bacterium]|nr:indole-3-glycerol-phosphate synthase [Microbacteriaceae bacterium]MCL2793914.1 indole-3-glycerol-phosphate synthase [Microbacteriaceae bacterium]